MGFGRCGLRTGITELPGADVVLKVTLLEAYAFARRNLNEGKQPTVLEVVDSAGAAAEKYCCFFDSKKSLLGRKSRGLIGIMDGHLRILRAKRTFNSRCERTVRADE